MTHNNGRLSPTPGEVPSGQARVCRRQSAICELSEKEDETDGEKSCNSGLKWREYSPEEWRSEM